MEESNAAVRSAATGRRSLRCGLAMALLCAAVAWRAAPQQAREPAPAAQTPPRTFTNSVGMRFVLIAPSSFQKGYYSPVSKPFYLQVTEVTQSQWEAVMGTNPSKFRGPDRPVELVNWEDVQEFLKRLNAKEKDGRYRLPTGDEWECACRAGGLEPDEADNLDEVAWSPDNSMGQTHPVGQKKPNAWGLFDLRGNVWEWVDAESFGPGARWLCGGSWSDELAGPFRCTDRGRIRPTNRVGLSGFRCARTP